MIKRQLNPLRIGKGLLCLLALFVMLLAPQGAWAEDYALTIAGQQYTDEQLKSTITLTSTQSTYITGGSITITPASSSDPVKLTFDNVTLSSNIVSNIDLEVYLIGGSEIRYSPSMNNPDPCFKGNNNSLIFTTSETNPGSLFISKTSSMDDFASGWGGDSTTPIWDEDCSNDPNGYYWWVDQSCEYMSLKVNKKYDLEMNGSQVCDATFKKLSPYADFPSIYMSDAQTLVVNGDYEYPITSNMPALTVAVARKVTLSSIRFASKGSVTSGTLTISKYTNSSSNEVSLTLNNTNDNDPTIYGFSSVTIANPMSLKTPNTVPDNWNSYFDEVFISNYVSYGITVGGEEVTDKNAENIFNDVNPSAAFNNTTNTLTFNNINVERLWDYSPFIVNGRGNLIIQIEGTQNNIKCGSQFIAKSNASASDYTVTITTDQNNRGKLTYTTYSSEFSSGHKVIFNNGLGWKKSGPDSESHYNMTIDQTGYDLSVGGESVTSNNASNITGDYITGDGTVSYDPVTNTLTLNNATIDLSQMEGPGIEYTGTENFTIKLIGTNSVKVANNCEPIIYDPVVAPTQIPTLTFKSGSFPCSLSLQGSNSTVIKYFGGVQGVNGLGSTTGDLYLIADEQAQYIANTGLYKGETTSSGAVTSATITSGYGIFVAGELVHEGNADNVLGDELENHRVKYNAINNTLTLNGANLVEGSIDYCGTDDLTIAIDGNSKLFSINYVNDEVNDIPELTITKASGATDCSLALNSNGDGSVISGFSALNYGTFNTISSAPISYGKIDPAENSVCLFDAVTNERMSDVTFTTATTYPLWVAGNQVTAEHAGNVLPTQGDAAPTVSFTPAGDDPATLTLNGVDYSPEGTNPFVISGLDNLTVKLAGSSSVYASSQAEVTPVAAFVSTNSDAVLTFTTDESTNLQLLNTNTIELASGFSSIAFTGYLYRDQNMVKNLLAPTPSMDDNYLQIGRAGYEPDATTFNYVIEYEDESQSVNGTYDMSKTASENNIVLDKPCTVTVFAQYGTLKSAEKVGKLFGFAQNEVSGLPGSMVDIPAIVPTIINSDGIEISHEGVDVNETITKIDLTEASYGKTILYLYFAAGETTPYVILNESAELRVNVIPADPTIAFDETKNYLNSDKVSISLPESLVEDENASIMYSWVENCEPGNGSNYDDDTKVALNAGTNTLYAWVRYNGATADDAVYSERVSQEFTVKTDINQLAVKDLLTTQPTYTGEEIVPPFTLSDPKDETNTVSADNYDVVIKKYMGEDAGFSVVESIVNTGVYRVFAVGKGTTYGGEKLIYEVLEVNPATITEVTLNKTSVPYTGAAQTITISSVKAGEFVLGANDYTVIYEKINSDETTTQIAQSDVKAVGSYNVVVTGQGNFTGTESATFSIVNRTLADNEVTFYNNWATYYSAVGDVMLPEGIGAFIVLESGIGENTVTVTPINYVPEKVAVLLSNDDKVVTQTDNTSAAGNMLRHADEDVDADDFEGLIYGLHNGTFMRVTGIIPADRNYLVAWEAQAPQLTIVFDGEMTGINDVRSKTAETGADFYDMQGRKVQKPSKKGLYISNGHKVVVK